MVKLRVFSKECTWPNQYVTSPPARGKGKEDTEEEEEEEGREETERESWMN